MDACLAIPTLAPGGLDAPVSPHFGHCDGFTLVRIEADRIAGAEVVTPPPHQGGGCMVPVNLVAGSGATAVAVAGIGGRPLMGFAEVGLPVFRNSGTGTAREVALAFAAGELPRFDPEGVCGGGEHHH